MYKEIASNKRLTILFIFVFIIVVFLLSYAFAEINGMGYGGIVLAGLISIPSALIGYYASDKIALSVNGAHELNKQENLEIYRLVENLTIATGLPMPKIYIIEDEAMNAFATGRDPKHASIALTTGLINRLNKNELQGVIAHELSHVKNYDIRLGTIIVVFVGIITLLADWIWRFSFLRKSNKNSGQLGLIFLVVGILLAALAPLGAKIIQLALSRQREYLADADSALMTRYPDGLASALEKISQDEGTLQRMNKATAHLYITDPAHTDDNVTVERKVSWLQKLFSTHPPIQDRIARLRTMGK